MADKEPQFVEITKSESGKTVAKCHRCPWTDESFDSNWTLHAGIVHETMVCEYREDKKSTHNDGTITHDPLSWF